MEEGAAEVGEPDGYYADFWGMEGKQKGNWGWEQTQSSIPELPPPPYICHGFPVYCPKDSRLVNWEVKNRHSSDIFTYTCSIASRASCKVAVQKMGNG